MSADPGNINHLNADKGEPSRPNRDTADLTGEESRALIDEMERRQREPFEDQDSTADAA